LFPTYANPIDTSNLLPIIRGQWGLTAQLDQQIGGVMMWATGGFGYIVGVIVVMIRWYRRDLVKTFQENMALELAGEAQAAENEKARLAGAIIEA
jgi:cytochrome c oxidase assembly factor CtaG